MSDTAESAEKAADLPDDIRCREEDEDQRNAKKNEKGPHHNYGRIDLTMSPTDRVEWETNGVSAGFRR